MCVHCVAGATHTAGSMGIPALKGRVKFMATLRGAITNGSYIQRHFPLDLICAPAESTSSTLWARCLVVSYDQLVEFFEELRILRQLAPMCSSHSCYDVSHTAAID